MSIARTAVAVIAWIFVAMVVIQVFLAGMGLLGGAGMGTHVDFGYLLSMVPLGMVLAAAIARAGRLAWYGAGLLALTVVQTVLPMFRDSVPFVAALHPVNALAIFWLGLAIARRATALARRDEPAAVAEPARAV